MTLISYSSLCDDFYIDMHINTKLNLPTQRDTILAFFERVQKSFPTMAHFYRRENNEYCLEENRNLGQYRWLSLEIDRIYSGMVNPPCFEDAYHQDRLVLELVPFMLGVSRLDIYSLDLTFAMDFDFIGNHDEVIAEALFGTSAFSDLLDMPYARPIGFSPSIVIALSEDERTQARISIESRTSVFEPSDKQNSRDNAISLSLTVRQYPHPSRSFNTQKSFESQCQLAEELMAEKIVPYIVQPIIEKIAQKRST
jgi:hypothetical protein